ncbi:GGDEF domain-containing protein [Pseudoalteromonas sp. GB56]
METTASNMLLLFDCDGICSAVFPQCFKHYIGHHFDIFEFYDHNNALAVNHLKEDELYSVKVTCDGKTFKGELRTCSGDKVHIMASLKVCETQYHKLSSAERLRTIIDSTNAGTWEWNCQTGELSVSERWAEIIGYTLDELAPVSIDTWLKFVHPEDLIRSDAAIQRHFTGQDKMYQCDVRMKHKLGHWVWIGDYGRIATFTKDNKPEWITGTHIDITERIQTINELEKVRNELNSIIDSVPAAIFKSNLHDHEGFNYISSEIERITGYGAQCVSHNSAWWLAQIHVQDKEALQAEFKHWQREGAIGVCKYDYRFRHQQGHYVWLSEHIQRVKTPTLTNGETESIVGSIFDKTESMSLNARMDALAQILPGMIYQFVLTEARSWHLVYASEGIKRVFELTPEQAIRNPTIMLSKIAHEDRETLLDAIINSANELEDLMCEFKVMLKEDAKWLFAHAIPQRQSDGGIMWTGMMIDITERKQLELRLREESTTDPLTGLYNRRYFFEQLNLKLSQSEREEQPLSLIILDLDFFKQINDQYGHDCGDTVLQTVSQAILGVMRKYDVVARIGGEEFSIILPNTPLHFGINVAEKVREQIETTVINHNDLMIQITATLGVASTEQTGQRIDALFKLADDCLYRGKDKTRNCVISPQEPLTQRAN